MFAGEIPVCRSCEDGAPCSFERVAAQKKTEAQEDEWGEPISSPPPVKIFTPDQIEAANAYASTAKFVESPTRWRDLLGEEGALMVINQAHADAKAGRHLERATIAKKPAAVAPVENPVAYALKRQRKPLPTLTSEQIVAKIKDGQAKARAEGKHVGRPRAAVDPAAVAELRDSGLSWRNIAKTLGTGKGTAERLYKDWQNEAPKEKPVYQAVTPELEAQIVEALQGGMKVNAVARKFKIGYYVVDGIRQRTDIASKSRFDAAPTKAEGVPQEQGEVTVSATMPESFVPATFRDTDPVWCRLRDGKLAEAPAVLESVPVAVAETAPPQVEIPKDVPALVEDSNACLGTGNCTCERCFPPMDPWTRLSIPTPRISITFDISEAGAIAMFSDLSISQKAAALRAALEASWRV
jgi:hypothetical protein